MDKRIFIIAGLLALSMASCSDKEADAKITKLTAPANLLVEQTSDTEAVLTWEGSSDAGYRLFLREENAGYYVEPVATTNATEYAFSGLATGKSYYFGVQALAKDAKKHSDISYSGLFKILDLTHMPGVTVSDLACTSSYIRLCCTYNNIPAANPEHGICYSTTGTPTVEDSCAQGPIIPSGKTLLQVIPCTLLDYGKTYHMRAYVKVDDEYFYSDEFTAGLSDAPSPITFDWTEITGFNIPSSIKVYKTATSLNGRKLNAWYAIADCSSDIELRVLNPSKAATVDKQMEAAGEDCYVLINGGFFYNGHIGAMVSDGTLSGEIYGAMGDIRKGYPETDAWYSCNRSVVGVDASGKPAAWWWRVRNGSAYYYTSPMPTVKGEAHYDWNSYTGETADWNPRNAISAGPMVLYDGKVLVEYTLNSSHTGYGNFWYSNYEMLAYDIFDQDQRPDRTAIGCTADGKVVLFICDGRLPGESLGADLTELGQIMKGLGCVSAMNLDGGGSTGMMVRGTSENVHLNNWYQNGALEYRAVYTTVGFFKKK